MGGVVYCQKESEEREVDKALLWEIMIFTIGEDDHQTSIILQKAMPLS